jgi:hypothetical protein
MLSRITKFVKNNTQGLIAKNSSEYETCKRAIKENIPDIILNLKNKICGKPLSKEDKITASITTIDKYLGTLHTQTDYNEGSDDLSDGEIFVFTRDLLTNIQSFMKVDTQNISEEEFKNATKKLFANNEKIFEDIKEQNNEKAMKLLGPFKDFLVKDPDCNTITIDDTATIGGKPRSKRSRKNKNTNKKSKNTRRKSIHRRHRR